MRTIKTLLALHLVALVTNAYGAAHNKIVTLHKDEARVVHIKPNLVIDHSMFLFFDGKKFDGQNVRLSSSDEVPPAGTSFEYGTNEKGKIMFVNFTENGLQKIKLLPLEQASLQIPIQLSDEEPIDTTPVGQITIESMQKIQIITSVLPGSSPPMCSGKRVKGYRVQLSFSTKLLTLLKACQQKKLSISANITDDEAQIFNNLKK